MNKEEYIIDTYNMKGKYGVDLKLRKTNLDREFVKMNNGTLRLLIDKNKLLIENEFQMSKRLITENEEINNKSKAIIESSSQNKSEDTDIKSMLQEFILDMSNKMESITKRLDNIDNTVTDTEIKVVSIADKVDRMEEKVNQMEEEKYIGAANHYEINNLSEEENKLERYSDLNSNDLKSDDLNLEIETDIENLQNLDCNMEEDKPKPHRDHKEPIFKTNTYADKKRYEYASDKIEENRKNRGEKHLWRKRLGLKTDYKGEYEPLETEELGILDLDCVKDTNKEIQKWTAEIGRRLIEAKISLEDTPDYIERTVIGNVKLFLQSIGEKENNTYKGKTKINGEPISKNTDYLDNYETLIRRQFGSLNADLNAVKKKREKARINLIQIKIFNPF